MSAADHIIWGGNINFSFCHLLVGTEVAGTSWEGPMPGSVGSTLIAVLYFLSPEYSFLFYSYILFIITIQK